MILFCLIILSHSCWVCGSNPDLSLNSRLVNTVAYSAFMCRYPKGSSANVCRMELWAPHLPQACPSEETVTSSTQLLKPDTPTAILSVTFSLARHIQATSSKLCHPFSKCVAPGRGHRVAQSRWPVLWLLRSATHAHSHGAGGTAGTPSRTAHCMPAL